MADVTLDNGRTVPMVASEAELQEYGLQPMPAGPAMDPMATAELTGAPRVQIGQGPTPQQVLSDIRSRPEPGPPALPPGRVQLGGGPAPFGVTAQQVSEATDGAGGIQLPAGFSVQSAPPARPQGPMLGQGPGLQLPAGFAPQTIRTDPAKLAQPKALPAGQQAASGAPGRTTDPAEEALIQRAFQEAARGRRFGPTPARTDLESRKAKFFKPGEVDPELKAQVDFERDYQRQMGLQEIERKYKTQSGLDEKWANELSLRELELQRQDTKRQQVDMYLGSLQRIRDERQSEARRMKAPDVRDYWGENAGGSFAALVAVAIGGYLQGKRGGENEGMVAVDRNINRWIETKREDYERARTTEDNAENEYSKALAIYGSPQQAEADMRLRAYAVRDAMFEHEANRIRTLEAKEAAKLAIMDGSVAENEARLQAQAAAGADVEEVYKHTPGRAGGTSGGGLLGGLRAAAQAKQYLDIAAGRDDQDPRREEHERQDLGRSLAVPELGEGRFYAANSGDRDKINDALDAARTMKHNYRRMLAIVERGGAGKLDREQRGQIEAIAKENILVAKNFHKLGALSGADVELVTPLSGEGLLDEGTTDSRVKGQIEEAFGALQRGEQRAYQQLSPDKMMNTSAGAKPASTFKPVE